MITDSVLPLFSSCVVQLLRQEQHAAMKSNKNQRDLPWNWLLFDFNCEALYLSIIALRSVVPPRESSSFHCTDMWLIVMTGRSERPNLFTWQITLCTLNLLCNLKTQTVMRVQWHRSSLWNLMRVDFSKSSFDFDFAMGLGSFYFNIFELWNERNFSVCCGIFMLLFFFFSFSYKIVMTSH